MTMSCNIDKIEIFNLEHSIIVVEGWLYSEKNSVSEIHCFANGELIDSSFSRVPRLDVCKALKAQDYNDVIGFQLFARNREKLNSLNIEIIDRTGTSTILLDYDEKQIQEKTIVQSTVHSLDNVTFDPNNKICVLYGSLVSLTNDIRLTAKIYDSENKSVELAYRNTLRKDLVRKYCLPDSQSLCGYMISFEATAGGKYFIQFTDENNTIVANTDFVVPVPVKESKFRKIARYIRLVNADNMKLGMSYLKTNGVGKTLQRFAKGNVPAGRVVYDEWFKQHRVSAFELKRQKETVFEYSPKISILVPTFNTPVSYLDEMISTVQNQSYSNWELCIADASNPDNTVRGRLKAYASDDSRIKVKFLDANLGISGNTNEALALATGEYIALYDHDDFLELDALYEVVKSLQEYTYDVIYTDEDKFNNKTKMFDSPHFKPDFSIDLLRSYNYITHFFVARTSLVHEVGGFRKEYDGAQDYDLIFRCIEKANAVYHIPKVLYHWRMHPLSTAANPKSKMYCYEAGQNAVQGNLDRCGIQGSVELIGEPHWGCYYVDYKLDPQPLVSILIPNYESKEVLERCINSLFKVNTYKNFEVIIIENNSTSKEIFAYYDQIQKEHDNVHVITWKGKGFNYSALNNFGAKYAKGEYLLLLNNDTEMINPDSLYNLVDYCQREDVGVVGAKLLYPNDTVQHAGVVIGFGTVAGHVFLGYPKDSIGYFNRTNMVGNWSAVTGACLMTKKELFDEVDGLSEELAVAFNDIDYCLKVRKLNKLVVLNPRSLWYHYESVSRGYENDFKKIKRFEGEVKIFQENWKDILVSGDPYYNINFDIGYTPFIVH